jgi:hypothetical protein
VADIQISVPQVADAPSTYLLAGGVEFVLKTVNADLDGSGSASAWLPCVTIKSDSGQVVARAVDQGVKVAAGGSAGVSWFPWLKHRGAGAAEPNCTLLGSGNGTDTLTVTLSSAVPADGVLQVVLAGVAVGHDNDGGSIPNSASDSGGNPGWNAYSSNQCQIGLSRQTVSVVPKFDMIVGSVLRPCVAGDLGVGSTITVGFNTAFPADFKSAGLAIWQHTFVDAILQKTPPFFPSIQYGNGDSYPDFSADPTTLAWFVDYAPWATFPVHDAIMLTGMGAYPATAGFQPTEGSLIGEIASGDVSIAAACSGRLVNVVPEPGGTWPLASQRALDGNYQMCWPRTFS